MKYVFYIVLILLVHVSYGQTQIKKSNISSGGGSAANGNITAIFSVGELAVQEKTMASTHLSEGFIGPDVFVVLGITEYGVLSDFTVSPNPVVHNLGIQWEQSGEYDVYLYDLNGKQLLAKKINNQTTATLNLSGYSSALYLLVVVDRTNHLFKQLKIIKQ